MDITKLNDLGEIFEDKIEVGPGRMYKDIHDLIDKEGLYFPPYPSSWRICTIGGMVANNAAGPNSLKYGHTSEFVESLRVVLDDGEIYEINTLDYKQLQEAISRGDRLSGIYSFLWKNIEQNYSFIKETKPDSSKNSSGYELWDVLQAESVEEFMAGKGSFNAVHAFCGSQGTFGVVVSVTLRLIEKPEHSELLMIPVYDIETMGETITKLLQYKPYNIELFDGKSLELAMANMDFFTKFYNKKGYKVFVKTLKTLWKKVYKKNTPAFTLMVLFDAQDKAAADSIAEKASGVLDGALMISDAISQEVLWHIRGSSYSLAKLTPDDDRPAAFLEDIVVSPERIPEFLKEVEVRLSKHGLKYAVHGHGGNGHFHFYPLFDFTDKQTPERIYKIAGEFYDLAKSLGANICGEHNDGIMRTPFMGAQFSPAELELFKRFENAADPEDIFNPGKKVNPKFDIKGFIRNKN